MSIWCARLKTPWVGKSNWLRLSPPHLIPYHRQNRTKLLLPWHKTATNRTLLMSLFRHRTSPTSTYSHHSRMYLSIWLIVWEVTAYYCTSLHADLWGKELHTQVGVGIVVTSGKPMWCNGSKMAWNGRCGFDSCSGYNVSHFCHIHDTGLILYKLHVVWLLNLPCVCVCKANAFMYVIVSINKLTIPWGQV